ncbi:DUF4440 domain-containing protein [Oxalobacteraceae bacterium OM1]|nr:DUF4440 domain-containing protein [Oxalobacteraceae bacterium OM1]
MAATFSKRLLATAVLAALAVQTGNASALGLIEAYEAALQNDPVYRSAVHDNEAGQQNRALGRSNLLPNVSASYSAYKNRADYTTPNFLGQETTTHPEYRSNSSAVQLRQPLFNLDGYARYKQGQAQANYSDAQFNARAQDLLLRLVSAYADAKYAEDTLALATVQRDTFAEQKAVNERMFQKGEGTKTDVLETQAKFDLAEAQLIEARDNLTTARNTLASIVGQDITDLDSLGDGFKVRPMQPATFEEWKTLALEQNAEITAQRYVVEASEQEVLKNRAGHAPRVDLVAAVSKGKSETLTTLNQDSTTRSLGVQVNIPIYSGGATTAASTQAVASREKAKSDLEAKTNQVLVELRKQYNLVLSSASRIDALVKSVQSGRALVTATQQSVKGGVRINLDVLNAQQQLFVAQRDLAQARYSYLLAYLRLRNAAGTLNGEDLSTIASYFVKGGSGATTAAVQPIDMLAETKRMAVPLRAALPLVPSVSPPVAPPVRAEAAAPAAERDVVLQAVSDWTQAWSARDVDAYLRFYADDFVSVNGQDRAAWAQERRTKISAKRFIKVQAEAPEVVIDGDTATVRFRQIYASDKTRDATAKTLTFTRRGGQWKIKQETVAG